MGFHLKLRTIGQLYQNMVKDPEKLAEWKKLRRHLEDLYKDRNKLAHWQVVDVNFNTKLGFNSPPLGAKKGNLFLS